MFNSEIFTVFFELRFTHDGLDQSIEVFRCELIISRVVFSPRCDTSGAGHRQIRSEASFSTMTLNSSWISME